MIEAEFAAVDAALSRFREDSEITALHRAAGRSASPSWRLVRALSAADRATRVTEGRFDPRVVGDLERLGSVGVQQTWPGPHARRGRLFEQLTPRGDRAGGIQLAAPVDLGGIGKGLALRWATRSAAAVLGGGFLLEAGGDLAVRGSAADGPWSIAIEDPRGFPEPVASILLEDGWAVATSSTRIGRWRSPEGRAVHHLIDPRTGEPGGAGLAAVTVAFPDPAWAEVWSKSLFLAGLDGIAPLARRRGLRAWWVDAGGELSMTAGARARTSWVRGEAA